MVKEMTSRGNKDAGKMFKTLYVLAVVKNLYKIVVLKTENMIAVTTTVASDPCCCRDQTYRSLYSVTIPDRRRKASRNPRMGESESWQNRT